VCPLAYGPIGVGDRDVVDLERAALARSKSTLGPPASVGWRGAADLGALGGKASDFDRNDVEQGVRKLQGWIFLRVVGVQGLLIEIAASWRRPATVDAGMPRTIWVL